MENPRIVAIGASAGGLDAFRELLENLPVNTNMAFVLLSHILRGSRSLLSEILARSTKMPVILVTDKTSIQANHIYVLPADKFMEINGGQLRLIDRPPEKVNTAINHFLFSLANDRDHGSIGIILSGEGSDGAEGIKNLKESVGGTTFAQVPNLASSQSMPVHAIKIDHVDYILSPKEIAQKLASISWCDENILETPLKIFWTKHLTKP